MAETEPWTWEPWMEPYRSAIFLPCHNTVEEDIDDEVVQAQIGLLAALRKRNGLTLVPAEDAVPTFTVSYADRFAGPLLCEQASLCESYGLSRQARLTSELARTVREWQSRNLDKLTPAPGVIPVRLDGAA